MPPEKVVIEKVKNTDNRYKVTMNVTQGKVLALVRALEIYSSQSPVGEDLYNMIKAANPPT